MRSSWMQSASRQKSREGTLANQMPEKSGLPPGMRGTGAFRSGAPLGRRGIPGVGYFNHWAPAGVASTHSSSTAHNTFMAGILLPDGTESPVPQRHKQGV